MSYNCWRAAELQFRGKFFAFVLYVHNFDISINQSTKYKTKSYIDFLTKLLTSNVSF